MKEQDTRFENEFEQELSQNAIDQFNTLQAFSSQPTSLLENRWNSSHARAGHVVDKQGKAPKEANSLVSKPRAMLRQSGEHTGS